MAPKKEASVEDAIDVMDACEENVDMRLDCCDSCDSQVSVRLGGVGSKLVGVLETIVMALDVFLVLPFGKSKSKNVSSLWSQLMVFL